MKAIVDGVIRFQNEQQPTKQALFDQLAGAQSPDVLLVTCADSRIDPGLITQTEPGDLFICRNAGNIVPPLPGYSGDIAASVEFGVAALGVKHIIVMGHTDCGAMKGAMNREAVASLPKVYEWLGYAEEAASAAASNSDDPLLAVTEANVLLQLQNLKTHPAVSAGLEAGTLDLHGWVYHIGSGAVTCHDAAVSKFVPLADHYAHLLS